MTRLTVIRNARHWRTGAPVELAFTEDGIVDPRHQIVEIHVIRVNVDIA